MKRILWSAGAALLLSVLLGAAWLLGRQPSPPQAEGSPLPWFRDITDEAGLTFVHDTDPQGVKDYFMPVSVGSGAALLDFDNDGRLDILLLQNGGPASKSVNRLFRQERNGRFTDVSSGSGLDVAGWGMGVAVGDVNNDGWPDVLVTQYGQARLFVNNKNGTFTDITKEAGLDNPHWGTSAAFVDYDHDGWLDLVIVNYVEYMRGNVCTDNRQRQNFCPPASYSGTATALFRNRGRTAGGPPGAVHFEDRTTHSGLGAARGPGLGVVCADFNADGWPDILIANDGKPNHLWINQKNGTFKEQAVLYGVAYNGAGVAQANMGVAVGDVDGDGLFDLFITHEPDELNVCWKQGPVGMFQDRTALMGLANPTWRATGFGTALADCDHDGALDIAVANGGVLVPAQLPPEAAYSFWGRYVERNQLFVNDGKGRFRDISAHDPFCREAGVGRGLAVADIDGDGALDLLVTRIGSSARLYKNVVPKRGHWLMVRALDPSLGGRDAYGAEVIVEAAGKTWKRLISPAYSYLCSNDPRAHFGLGQAGYVDAIRIVWPDGVREAFDGRGVDQAIVVSKGAGRAVAK
jgi:hypothetical protein